MQILLLFRIFFSLTQKLALISRIIRIFLVTGDDPRFFFLFFNLILPITSENGILSIKETGKVFLGVKFFRGKKLLLWPIKTLSLFWNFVSEVILQSISLVVVIADCYCCSRGEERYLWRLFSEIRMSLAFLALRRNIARLVSRDTIQLLIRVLRLLASAKFCLISSRCARICACRMWGKRSRVEIIDPSY